MRRMVLGLSAIYIVTITLLVGADAVEPAGRRREPVRAGAGGDRHSRRRGRDELRRAERRAVELEREPLPDLADAVLAGARRLRAAGARRGHRDVARRSTRCSCRASGSGAAVLVRALWPDSAYVWFFGVALFGALFVWLMIFVTHIAFRAGPAVGRGGSRAAPGRGGPDRRDPGVHLVGAGSAVHAPRRRTVARCCWRSAIDCRPRACQRAYVEPSRGCPAHAWVSSRETRRHDDLQAVRDRREAVGEREVFESRRNHIEASPR